jgi:hypothetical protein
MKACQILIRHLFKTKKDALRGGETFIVFDQGALAYQSFSFWRGSATTLR